MIQIVANKRGPKPGNAKGGVAPQSTALARVRAHEIARSDQAPLKIMLDNMMFWHNQSKLMADQIQLALDDLKINGSEEAVKEADKLLRNFIAARQNAQSCAVDAAPYVHPKLQSVTIKPSAAEVIEVETRIVNTGARGEAVAYRENYDASNVTPIRRPN